MFTIVEFGNKQYKVVDGSVIDVDFIANANPGDPVALKHVISFNNAQISSLNVEGKVINHVRGEKVTSFYHKRRKHHRRTKGHTQEHTKIVVSIS